MSWEEGKWKNASAGIQIYMLLAFWFLGMILAASVVNILLGDAMYSSATNIRISNSIGSVFLFLVPTTIYSILFTKNDGEYLIRKPVIGKVVLLAALTIFCIQAFVQTVNYFNELIILPDSMASLQEFFDSSKEMSLKASKLVLAEKTIDSLLINLLVMAVLPGVVEELFFRGCMQRSMNNISGNIHAAIWITAIIFSLLHMQLAGFFPRIILGALLGYLYAWTKNIWIPIIVHVIHNTTIIVIEQMLSDTELYNSINSSDYSLSIDGLYAFISLVITIVLLTIIYKVCSEKSKDTITQEHSD